MWNPCTVEEDSLLYSLYFWQSVRSRVFPSCSLLVGRLVELPNGCLDQFLCFLLFAFGLAHI